MSSTPPDCDEVEAGSPFGGAECEESSPEPQPSAEGEQGEENLFPFDNLAVEYYEEPDEDAGSKDADVNNDAVLDDNSESAADSTCQDGNEDATTSDVYDVNVVIKEESIDPDYKEIQKSYLEDFIYSNTSSFDEGSNSNFDDTREEPKGSPLSRFPKTAKAIEMAEYETLQVLYQLLFQRSAWDTQEILAQRILDFSGFTFNEKSEDYFNREMMLRTQPNDVLVKIGVILGLDQVQKMLADMDSGRVELISSIMYFLSRPNKRTRAGLKCADETGKTPSPRTPSKCGCRNRCFKKFTQAEQKRLLEYKKELEDKNLLDNYLLSLMECKKIVRYPGSTENYKKLKEVTYSYKCKFGRKESTVCKGAFVILHGVKLSKMNYLQNKLKSLLNSPSQIDVGAFPPIASEETTSVTNTSEVVNSPRPAPSSRNNRPNPRNAKKTWVSSEDQVKQLEEELKASIQSHNVVLPKVVVEKCDLQKALADLKPKTDLNDDKKPESNDKEEVPSEIKHENVVLRDFPLVVTAIESASEELLLDVHFLLFLNSADADKVKENILQFGGFSFDSDTEEYDERIEFLQRMSSKIVSDVARSFSLEILSTKEATIKNILTFLTKPAESFLRITSSMPLSLSDVELDDIGDMSDSDVSITCEVVEKNVECIDLLSSGEDSDREDKPRKDKKITPKKGNIPSKQATSIPPKQGTANVLPRQGTGLVLQHSTTPTVRPIVIQPQVQPSVSASQTTPTSHANSLPGGKRTLRNFETICKIVNTHPHEYLIDIYDLLYLSKHEPSTLRDDILNFSGFTFDKTSPDYVKRKQLLDRMLYNSVRRIYNTLIHNTTEVKVFSKPTMITEIFQFLFNLPENDTSVRPLPTPKPLPKPFVPGPPIMKNLLPSAAAVVPPGAGAVLPSQTGKLSDLKRVFQRVACFPCEYLIDVHKLLFMTDCDSKVIRNNIFAFKGFNFGVDSQEFQQRKMYLEYLTFHSLRKISSVLTTRSVDLRNSTKHELATHLTQVLAEYCNTYVAETDTPASEANSQTGQTDVTSSSPAVENIVVTPFIDPSYANPPSTEVESPASTLTPNISSSTTSNTSKTQAAPVLAISIVDARSVNSPSVTTTTSSRGRRKRSVPAKVKSTPTPTQLEPSQQFADINLPEVEQYRQLYSQNLNIYQPSVPTITGIATFNASGVRQPLPQAVTIPMINPYSQPIQVSPSQILGMPRKLSPTIVTQVPSKQNEIIVPGECLIEPEESSPPSKKSKLSSTPEDSNSFHNKIRDAINSEDEDCDKPLSSLVGHPIDSVLKKHIVDIVEQSDLASITINGVIQKIFNMYPKFDLSYRKEFIKSILRSMLYRLGEQKKSGVNDQRDTNSPDCSVTTTENCNDALKESLESTMECS